VTSQVAAHRCPLSSAAVRRNRRKPAPRCAAFDSTPASSLPWPTPQKRVRASCGALP
jgi:hypothetical protein